MRRTSLHKAKLIVKVESYKNSPIPLCDNPLMTIRTISIYDNRTDTFWSEDKIQERGVKNFLNVEDLKETLNWNLNGDSSKYQFIWGQSGKDSTDGVAYIFD